ncbi:unnamed protein product [marine sediment metagenome]|uniref:Uncharacterized protein n=1 Tax=marine sediment metagenome TaxID=412755 RepID=X1QF97_9ZZZZ
MEEIMCIFCEKESDQVVIKENGFKGKKCPTCGLIYISPRPTFSWMEYPSVLPFRSSKCYTF